MPRRTCFGRRASCRFIAFVAAHIVAVHSLAWATHPLLTDDAGTQGPGGILIESNVNYLKDDQFRSTVVPVSVTAGIGESIDVEADVPYLWLDPSHATGSNERGFSDVIFKFKQRFYEREEKVGEHGKLEQSFAYEVLYSQPTGNGEKGLGAGSSRWAARMISTTELNAVEIDANLGYESSGRALRRGNLTFDEAVFLSIAAKYDRSKPWEPVVELAVTRVKEPDAVTRIETALVGLIYEPSEKYYVDAGLRVGLNSSSEDYAVQAGFGCKF
jgi:hypothetical protein